jgi:hypothetical protein
MNRSNSDVETIRKAKWDRDGTMSSRNRVRRGTMFVTANDLQR